MPAKKNEELAAVQAQPFPTERFGEGHEQVHVYPSRHHVIPTPRGRYRLCVWTQNDFVGVFRYHPAYRLQMSPAKVYSLFRPGIPEDLPRGVGYNVVPGGVNMDLFVPLSKPLCRERLGLNSRKFLVLLAGIRTNPASVLSGQTGG